MTALAQRQRLFRREFHEAVVARANAGQTVIVAGSSMHVAHHFLREFQLVEGLVGVARFVRANGAERIAMRNGGQIIFTSVNSHRVRGLHADAAFVHYEADGAYLAEILPCLLGGQLFEIDA